MRRFIINCILLLHLMLTPPSVHCGQLTAKSSLLYLCLFDDAFSTLRSIRSIGLSVPHRKHITPPLQAQQVNAICRFVTTVY
jgi:hypothetical protein